MARLTQVPLATGRSVSGAADSLLDLNRLLARLQQTILQADTERERRLRTSEYERNKAEIVRCEPPFSLFLLPPPTSILLTNEHITPALTPNDRTSSTRAHSWRDLSTTPQADFARKRDLLERLAERLRELEDLSIDSDDDHGGGGGDDEAAGDSDDSEDLLGDSGKIVIQTPSASASEDSRSVSRHAPDEGGLRRGSVREADESGIRNSPPDSASHASHRAEPIAQTQAPASTPTPTPIPQPEPQATETTTSQTLRPRGAAAASAAAATMTHDRGNTTARRELFGDRGSAATGAEAGTTATTEAILDHHRAEQDALTESLVQMASALKKSSQAFSTSLESERGVLDAAGQGLARNETGLEAAARRMGALRRATEGRGWWGRVLLYAWIGGLAVLAVLIVFVLPKLRF